jgi:hypothetical protein
MELKFQGLKRINPEDQLLKEKQQYKLLINSL